MSYRCGDCLSGPRPMPKAGNCPECNRRMTYVRDWRARGVEVVRKERERVKVRLRLLEYVEGRLTR